MTKTIGRYEYDDIGPFHRGLAPAMKDGREYHIRVDGSPVYEVKVNMVGDWYDRITLRKTYRPETINGYSYDAIGPFHRGLAPAMKDGREYHIRVDGSPVYEVKVNMVDDWYDRVPNPPKDGPYFRLRSDVED